MIQVGLFCELYNQSAESAAKILKVQITDSIRGAKQAGFPMGGLCRAKQRLTATGLTWQKQDDNTQRVWPVFVSYCQGLHLGGKSDWRLPDIKEPQSIVDYRFRDPAIYVIAFPGTDSSYYWSATTNANYSAIVAWFVYFNDGYVGGNGKSNTYYVRCIRSGQ